ncbi:hypothetical protein B0T25DRAFT_5554 [Lasiosphaeria hispida]|uniref:Uncharacterized protein n=1 Tax=Lasiosphaeria hispida TaxID=260671 RepID=A0AAJ0HTL8_9PEZI|nr:hypothetical protein B0T25DRAFT_5554 [Lasiosphaeria hispida]
MRKIRTKQSSDDKLVEKCERETGKRCKGLTWSAFGDLDVLQPSGDILAIVVDMRTASNNSLYIHDFNNDFIDKVGLDYKGSMVIVPWQEGLKFICYGSCDVGVVQAKQESDDKDQRVTAAT